MKTDEDFMSLAIQLSRKAKYPYGCVIVDEQGKIIGRSDAQNQIGKFCNHAEMVAMADASENNLYGALNGATMYCSCEPCVMCFGAILYEKISRIVFAVTIDDSSENIAEEVPIRVRDLAKLAGSNIKIKEEFLRDEALKILHDYHAKVLRAI